MLWHSCTNAPLPSFNEDRDNPKEGPMPKKVFISYRRDDSKWPTDRLFQHLRRELPGGFVFMDTDVIPFGVDFVEYFDFWIRQCKVFLAIIGPRDDGVLVARIVRRSVVSVRCRRGRNGASRLHAIGHGAHGHRVGLRKEHLFLERVIDCSTGRICDLRELAPA